MKKTLISLAALALVFSQPVTADPQGQQASFSLNQQARQAATHAAAILASESADDSDGYPLPPAMSAAAVGAPLGGGFVPSIAPQTDGTRARLGYCAFDNGPTTTAAGRIPGVNSLSAPVIAVLAPGPDGVFSTSCNQIAASLPAQGDDLVVIYNTTQLRSLYALHIGPPVATMAALSTIPSSSLREGELRLVKADNSLQRWNSGAATWTAVSSSVSDPGQGIQLTKTASGSLAAPSVAFEADQSTGLFYTGAGLGVASGGVLVGTFSTSGLAVQNLTTTGNTIVGNTLVVTGATTLTGPLTAAAISTTTLATTGNATLAALAVTGPTTLTGHLTAAAISTTTLTTSSDATIAGSLTATGLLTATSGILASDITAATMTATGNVGAGSLLLSPYASSYPSSATTVAGMLIYRSDLARVKLATNTTTWIDITGFMPGLWNNFYTTIDAPNNCYLSSLQQNNFVAGQQAGKNLCGGTADADDNIALGQLALKSSASTASNYGYNNIALSRALEINKYGNNNFAAGWLSLNANALGSNKVAIGPRALSNTTNGSAETALGSDAGAWPGVVGTVTTGTSNTYVGASARTNANNSQSNRTAIGADAYVTKDATIVLGRVATDIVVLGSDTADTTTAGFGRLQVHGPITPGTDNSSTFGHSIRRWTAVFAGNGTIQTSDGRLKTNIAELNTEDSLKAILSLNPVRYNWLNPSEGTSRKIGFLAQELAQIIPESVYLPADPTGQGYLGVNYGEIIPALTAAIQQQQKIIGLFTPTQTGLNLSREFEADQIRARLIEVQKIKATEIDVERIIKSRVTTAGKVVSGELVLNGGNGCQPLFSMSEMSQYEVSAQTATGDWAALQISLSRRGPVIQSRESSAGSPIVLDVRGNSVCASVTSGSPAKATWLRLL